MRYTLGDYTLDTQRYELCRAGIPLQLQPKVFDLLAYLIQHRDRVVTRQDLFDALWPEQFVSEDALEWTIAEARRAVGDSGRAQRVIKTIRGRGYRLWRRLRNSSRLCLIMRRCLPQHVHLPLRKVLLWRIPWAGNASRSRCSPVPCLPW